MTASATLVTLRNQAVNRQTQAFDDTTFHPAFQEAFT